MSLVDEERWGDIVGERVYLLFFPYVMGDVIQVDRAPNRNEAIWAESASDLYKEVAADHNDFLTVKLTKPVRFEGAPDQDILKLPRWIWKRVEKVESKDKKTTRYGIPETCPICGTKRMTLLETITSRDVPPPNPGRPIEEVKDEEGLLAGIARKFRGFQTCKNCGKTVALVNRQGLCLECGRS